MTMEAKAVENKVKAILARQLKKRGMNVTVKNTDSIISAGILDSLSAIEIIAEMEKSFAVTILPEEMSDTNFDSIEKMVNFVILKLRSA